MNATDLDAIAEIIGPVAYREYENAGDVHRPALTDWILTLRDLDDEDFLGVAAAAIHGSALVNSFRGNWDHEHCKASAAYREAGRRHLAAGHDEDCRGDTIYDAAFRNVWRSQGYGHSAYPLKPCTCGAENA